MVITSADFVVSNSDPEKCPPGRLPEFAFIGRSNVGKSSLINLLVQRRDLAKTSSTPGKTQLINHFLINKKWHLVDLPGYGYAIASKRKKGEWAPMITDYLSGREQLVNTFVLLDPRLEPQKIDLEFIRWMGTEGIPFSLVFTKSDKMSRAQLGISVQAWKDAMLAEWEELPPVFITSSKEKKGRDELLNYIGQVVKEHHQS